MNLFRSPRPTRHTLDEPPQETPEQAATLDKTQIKRMDAELTAALQPVTGWRRFDCGSFVAAGCADGSATIVGNDLGNWRLVRIGPGDRPLPEPAPSAREALAKVSVDLKKQAKQ